MGVIFIVQDGFEDAIYFGVDLMLHGEILARAVLQEHGRNTGWGRGWREAVYHAGIKNRPRSLRKWGGLVGCCNRVMGLGAHLCYAG